MTTLRELIADVRADLQDSGASPRWSDAVLYVFIKDAIRDYSTWFPRRTDRAALAPAGAAWALPPDFIEAIQVETSPGVYLSRRSPVPGASYTNLAQPRCYALDAGGLYIYGPQPSSPLLTYYAVHPIPASEMDAGWVCTVPDRDLELIRLYVGGKAHAQMRAKQSRLDRFEVGSGRRDDNPVAPEAATLMAEYRLKIAERFGGRAVILYRP